MTDTRESRVVAEGYTRSEAIRTPQFALLWAMLCINVTAGIGILAQASPMMQDLFGKTPKEAAAIVAIISIFNAGGRLLWSSLSDLIGRRNTYLVFFSVQLALFLLVPRLAESGAWWGRASERHDFHRPRGSDGHWRSDSSGRRGRSYG
jgi:MFS family permease